MKGFKGLLEELDYTLQEYNLLEYEKLQSPLTNKEIDEYLFELGVKDDDFKSLFQWKNGSTEDSLCQIMIFGSFHPLDEVKKYKNSNDRYNKLLLEIITDNGEESILFNTNLGKNYGRLYFYSVDELYINYPISYYDSLYAMIETIIQAYKIGAYIYDEKEECLNLNFFKLKRLSKSINKTSIYWKDHNRLKWEDWYDI